MLNTGTSMISDVIGSDSESSAFVYGCYSLFEKLANGALLGYIVAFYNHDAAALRWIMGLTPIITSIVGYAFTYIGVRFFSDKLAKITGANLGG